MTQMFQPLTAADYDRALELWPTALMALVRNVGLAFHWLGDEDRFWFREETADGHRFCLVEAATGKKTPAFDHQRVGLALDADPNRLPIDHFTYAEAGSTLLADVAGRRLRIDLAAARATPVEPPRPASLPGPQGLRLFLRDDNIWLLKPDGTERALTDDGAPAHAWGAGPDHDYMAIARKRAGLPRSPSGCSWSPNGRLVLVQRVDERELEPYPYLDSVPIDGSPRPKLHFIRQQLPGEPEPMREWAVIDVATGRRHPVTARLPGRLRIGGDGAWWSADSRFVYVVAKSPDDKHVALVEITAADGRSRILHEEQARSFIDLNTFPYNTPNLRVLPNRSELLWYSEADGWGHLYIIDLIEGGVARRLTQGEWAVFDVLAVTDRAVFFTAGGREPGHPYYRYLYRVDLDAALPNAGLKLLTPGKADHGFAGEPAPAIAQALGRPVGLSQMSPTGRYFVDCVSRVDLAPRYLLRDDYGALIAEIAEADISALERSGWQPPEIFTAKAADGATDLYGVLVKPRAFTRRPSWPVLERIYGGPQINAQPRSFAEGLNGPFMHALNALAEMGFVVAVLDGPGTPYRSKTFRDMTYGQADRWGVAHHRAALENAARSRPWMDLSCVGVSGHSYGGYGTVMAMLLEPDFYQVGVASAGMYDLMWAYTGGVEKYFGSPDFGDGRAAKNDPAEVPDNYRGTSPSDWVERLRGHLMIVYGDLDENIQPAGTLKLVNDLIDAGKSFDLLTLPGRNHGFVPLPYYQKRLWDYFIERVQGRKPLGNHKLDVQPGIRMFI